MINKNSKDIFLQIVSIFYLIFQSGIEPIGCYTNMKTHQILGGKLGKNVLLNLIDDIIYKFKKRTMRI